MLHYFVGVHQPSLNSSTPSSEAEKNPWHPYADAEAGDSEGFPQGFFLELFVIIDY